MTIIIMEDDLWLAMLYAEAVEFWGYLVIEIAKNSLDATKEILEIGMKVNEYNAYLSKKS